MKRLSCLLLGILLVFSLCACQQAAPSSGEAPDQQAITEEATEYFNQMMDEQSAKYRFLYMRTSSSLPQLALQHNFSHYSQ